MKPAFALSFSATGISLHHHSDDEWFCIGSVALDAPDLEDQIQALREKGFALENDLSCKIVIPADQVRFLTVTTEGLPPKDRDQKAQAALAEATPYDVSELAFDTVIDEPATHVAAVARQTLEEARDFATKHGFIPVSYSAESGDHDYPAEPQFALTTNIAESAPLSEAAAQIKAEQPKSEEPASEENSLDPTPPVHPIAETADPAAFRSPPQPTVMPGTDATPAEPGLKRFALPAVAAAVVVGLAVGTWSLMGSDNTSDTPEANSAAVEVPQTEQEIQTAADTQQENTPPAATAAEEPELTATDAAILEALKVTPQPVEKVARDPEAQEDLHAQTGLVLTPPNAPLVPTPQQPDDLYLASIDRSDLSRDAVALPPVQKFETDAPFDQTALPSVAGSRFELDERGLVTPTPEGTLNPDGITVYLGRPSSVPPEVPVRFEEEPVIEESDQRLAGLRPRPRPGNLVERFERQNLGGRSLEELAVLRPKLRPDSLQAQPEVDHTPTALAVVRVPRPKARPAGIAARIPSSSTANLGSTAAVDQSSDEAGSFQPKSVAPKIPTTASVARQATMDNAINLRKLNLIGVYGTPANRRALVRLPSGRYKKLKVGDRVDGGKVVAIGDSELQYQKRGRNVTLRMPRG